MQSMQKRSRCKPEDILGIIFQSGGGGDVLNYNSLDLLLRSGLGDSWASILALGKSMLVATGFVLSTLIMGRVLRAGRRVQLLGSVAPTVVCMVAYAGAYYLWVRTS